MTTIATYRPSFVRIFYHSVLSSHVMNIGTRQWSESIGTFGSGGYTNWESDPRDADDMIKDLVNLIAATMPDTSDFDSYTIFNYPTSENIFVPVAAGSLAIAGTDAVPGQNGAVQRTYTLYDSTFKTFKLVTLDCASKNVWLKETAATATAEELAIVANLVNPFNAWQSRQNAQPVSLRSITTTLNDRLRREYDYA